MGDTKPDSAASGTLPDRQAVNAGLLAPEAPLVEALAASVRLDAAAKERIAATARSLVEAARAGLSLIHI